MIEFICSVMNISEKEVFKLPITEFQRKLNRALTIAGFYISGKINFVEGDAMEDKYDREFEYLKSIGYL